MELKDYYKILELPPSATRAEIKSAYRRLAHRYHPDKHGNDRYAAAQFHIIKEAYEVLTDTSRKEHYLQQRWYEQSMGRKTAASPTTPVTILKKSQQLDKYLSQLDIYRMDHLAVKESIREVFSDEHIDILNHFEEKEINNEIVRAMSGNIAHLPPEIAGELASLMHRLKADESIRQDVNKSLRISQKEERWSRLHPWVIILIVLILCLLFYLISD